MVDIGSTAVTLRHALFTSDQVGGRIGKSNPLPTKGTDLGQFTASNTFRGNPSAVGPALLNWTRTRVQAGSCTDRQRWPHRGDFSPIINRNIAELEKERFTLVRPQKHHIIGFELD